MRRVLCSIVLLALTRIAVASPSSQQLVRTAAGNLDLVRSDVCFSDNGQGFARRSGVACQVGDLAYLRVTTDSDAAADWAERHCDFDRPFPPEAQTVDGVLCYLRTVPRKTPAIGH
jgi:hypothetical protein